MLDQRSKLGYSSGSPFSMDSTNSIAANGITMKNTRRPLIAVNKRGAAQLQPGKNYSGINGDTTEMPIETLLELEPVLLEKHLSTLSDSDKEVFTEKYAVLGTDMKTAALTQMLAKYPDVAQAAQQQSMQSGGAVQTPLPSGNTPLWGNPGNTPLQGFYGAPQESTMLSPAPVTVPDAALMHDFQAQIDETTDRLLADRSPNDKNAWTENYDRPVSYSAKKRTLPLRDDREKKNGGEAMKNGGLTKAKTAEMLHDGTVHGEPITDKQRRYFAAIAFSDKKKGKMQSGGTTGGWKYEAPPTEGFHLVGIESNRPQSNIANLPPQVVTTSGKGRTTASGSPRKLQDTPDPGYEAFWAKQRGINNDRMSSEPSPYNWDAPPASTPSENSSTIDDLKRPEWYQESNPEWSQRSPNTDNTIRQLRNPQWMLQSRPAQPPVSNTSRAIAAVTADPVWNEIMYRTPMQRPRQEVYPPVRLRTEDAMGMRQPVMRASSTDQYQKWKSYKKFDIAGENAMTKDLQQVKYFSNGDVLLSMEEPGSSKRYFIRDSKTGKYAIVDLANKEEVDLLNNAK